MVYDITDEKSFLDLGQVWEKEMKLYLDGVGVLVVGNKSEKTDGQKQVDYQRGQKYAKGLDAVFMEVSAATGQNVNLAITKVVDQLITKRLDQNY